MSYIQDRLSDLEGEPLKEAVMERFRQDVDYRNECLRSGGTDDGFKKAKELFEAKSTDTDEDGIPHVNLIRRAVEDYLSVALNNVPSCRLFPKRFIPAGTPEWKRDVMTQVYNESGNVMNAYVKTILRGNDYTDKYKRGIFDAAVYGVGSMYVGIDTSNDLRESHELRRLLQKEEMTPNDMKRLKILKNRIQVEQYNPRGVYWENGKRHHKDTERVSYMEMESTQTLREEYGDKVEHPELIAPGHFPHGTEFHKEKLEGNQDAQTGLLTMWEMEPVEKERVIEGPEGEEETIPFTDWNVVRIKVAGGQVVEKEIFTGIPDDESEDGEGGPEEGVLSLPIVPIYVQESIEHPYGFSIPLMLSLSQKFINGMRAIIYKSARKAASSQGVVVSLPNLGDGDLNELERVLDEGGVARVEGNGGAFDVSDMVMPLNYNASPINPALMQSVNMEMGMFQSQSQTVNPEDLQGARTGAAKRAQMTASDRTKSISIQILTRSVEDIHQLVYKNIKVHHNEEVSVGVDVPGKGQEFVTLNEEYKRNVVVHDEDAKTPENPQGFRAEKFEMTLHDTSTDMYAQAEGKGQLPLDMISRFQVLTSLQQAGVLDPQTVRELTLEEEIQSIDDENRRERQQQQAAMQQAAAMTQRMDSPQAQRQMAGSPQDLQSFAAQPQGQGVTPQDTSRDAQMQSGMPLPA